MFSIHPYPSTLLQQFTFFSHVKFCASKLPSAEFLCLNINFILRKKKCCLMDAINECVIRVFCE